MRVWMVRLRWVVLVAIGVLGYLAPWGRVPGLGLGSGAGSGFGAGANAHLWGVLAVLLGKSGAVGVSAGFEVVLGVGIACAVAAAVMRTVVLTRGGGVGRAAVGTWLNVVAVSLLMPVSGAVFAVIAAAGWEWVIARESNDAPRRVGLGWAMVREVYFWGVAGSFAVAGWAYNAGLLARCVVVSLGVGIVVRGVMGRE
jgi:hypothetical protein